MLTQRLTFWIVLLGVVQFSSVAQSLSDSSRPHESQHARLPCPSPSPGVHLNSYPLSRWCHPPISSSVVPFSSCPQSLPASESFPMSQLFAWGGQSTGVSALASLWLFNCFSKTPLFLKFLYLLLRECHFLLLCQHRLEYLQHQKLQHVDLLFLYHDL